MWKPVIARTEGPKPFTFPTGEQGTQEHRLWGKPWGCHCHYCHFMSFRISLSLSLPIFQTEITVFDETMGQQSMCLHHCVPGPSHAGCVQGMCPFSFPFTDAHVFAVPAESGLKAWKGCLIFYLLFIIYFLFSKALQLFSER